MIADVHDLSAFVAVVRAGGFRDGARLTGGSASGLSEAVRRLETRRGVRLLNGTTRSVAPTEAGRRLAERLMPALGEPCPFEPIGRTWYGGKRTAPMACLAALASRWPATILNKSLIAPFDGAPLTIHQELDP